VGKYKVNYLKLLIPKAYDIVYIWNGRSSGSPRLVAPSRPNAYRNSGWSCLQHERITAAGTAPVFHRIPL